jgi:aminoglycoside phosphotransferase (APT) family kinase protein
LRRIHEARPPEVLSGEAGQVLVHGDYGPSNVLLDPASFRVVAVVDWEWARF